MVYIYTLNSSSKNYSEDNLLKDNLASAKGFTDSFFIYLKTNFSIKRISNNSPILKKNTSFLANCYLERLELANCQLGGS